MPDQLPYTFRGLLLYFLHLGATGFGGPIALVAHMERDLVETWGWLSREEFERGFALAQLAPGPVAAQLAMYIGYLRRGIAGATLVAFAFLLPSFCMVVLLGVFYVTYGGLPWVHAIFSSVGAAVIAIIVRSAYKLTRSNLKREPFLWMIAVVLALLNVFTHLDNIWMFLLAGAAAIVVFVPPRILRNRLNILIVPLVVILLYQLPDRNAGLIGTIFLYFAKAGAFVFGSGLTIVPFLHVGVVSQLHWLTEQQFMDAVAVAMITPGPVVITVGFIGYLVGGFWGAVAAALGVFLPVYLFVVIAARFVEKLAENPRVKAFVKGITAAATGAIAGSVIVLAQQAIIDVTTAVIALASFVLITRGKVPDPVIIVAAAAVGFALRALVL
jgi:chromate transporter